MDNPDRPPEPLCTQFAEEPNSPVGAGCAEPATIERDAGTLIQELLYDYLWIGFVVPFVMWLIGTIVLFGAGRLAGGRPTLLGSLSLAGWAAVPEFLRLLVGLAGLTYVLEGLTMTDVNQAATAFAAALTPVDPLLFSASLMTVAWQWVLLTSGLSEDADLPWGTTAVAVGIPLGLFFLVGIL